MRPSPYLNLPSKIFCHCANAPVLQGATLKQRTRSYTLHRMQKIQEKTHERLATLKFHPTFRNGASIYYIIQREILEFEIVLGYSHLEL